jgi:multicomponent Na+:H+ antiporter subunit E
METAVLFVFSLLFYLALTAGSGSLLLWSVEELFSGVLISLFVSVLAARLLSSAGLKPRTSWLNPVRWLMLLAYGCGPFFLAMAKANLDVAYRVITGRIRPGIVRIPTGLRTDFGTAFLANSITLTPGTLTVDADDKRNLYVHWINVTDRKPSASKVCGSFPVWARRIAE